MELSKEKLREMIKEEIQKLNESWNNRKAYLIYAKFTNDIDKEIQNADKYNIKISEKQKNLWNKKNNEMFHFLESIFN